MCQIGPELPKNYLLVFAIMHLRTVQPNDIEKIVLWNRQLQEDEGAELMSLAAITERMRRWLQSDYQAVVFELDYPVGYALYRATNPDTEGGGVYLRQFHISRSERRKGYGTAAFHQFAKEVLQGDRVILEVLETNPGGHSFWGSLGLQAYCTRYELKIP